MIAGKILMVPIHNSNRRQDFLSIGSSVFLSACQRPVSVRCKETRLFFIQGRFLCWSIRGKALICEFETLFERFCLVRPPKYSKMDCYLTAPFHKYGDGTGHKGAPPAVPSAGRASPYTCKFALLMLSSLGLFLYKVFVLLTVSLFSRSTITFRFEAESES